jgi:hypothetical protein
MLSAGFNPSSIVPMSQVHPAMLGPLMSVSVNAIFLIGESNPAMSWLSQRYPLTSSMKSSTFNRSPVNTWGSAPIVLISPVGSTGCYGTLAGFGPAPGPLGPPGPVGPPSGGPMYLSTVLNLLVIVAGVTPTMGFGLAALAGVTVTIGAILIADMLVAASLGLISTGLCLIWSSMGSGSGSSLLSELVSVLSSQLYLWTLGAGSPSLGSPVSLS